MEGTMDTSTDEVIKTVRNILATFLQEQGMRCTPERYAILEEIYRSEGHVTAEEIYRRLEQRFRVSQATVYNNMDLLAGLGLVVRHSFANAISYEKCYGVRDHFHQVCIKCGKVREVDAPQVSQALDSVRYYRFRLQNVAICAYGICAVCQTRMTKAHNRYLQQQDQKKKLNKVADQTGPEGKEKETTDKSTQKHES